MDALENIMTRRSVRRFLDKPIPDEALETILRAGMAGPSCVNARDWSFLVTRDPLIMNQMADANGRPADPLKRAALGILILGDLERAFKPAQAGSSLLAPTLMAASSEVGVSLPA